MRLLGTVVAVLLLTGCTATTTPDAAGSGRGLTPRPSPMSATPPPTPRRPVGVPLPVPVTKIEIPYPSSTEVDAWLPPNGPDASALEQIQRHIRYEALIQSRVRAPTSARCGRISFAPAAQSHCTVLYQGVPVPFTVVMDPDKPDSKNGANGLWLYRTYADRFIVRGDVIRDEAWRRWGSDGEPTRCSVLPAVQVLPPGRTRQRCQHLVDGAWTTVPVTITENGDVSLFG
jgi:hypothetical protein